MRQGGRRSGGWEGVVLLRVRPRCPGELPLKVTESGLPVILVYWFIQCGVILPANAQSGGARKWFQSPVSSNFLMFLVNVTDHIVTVVIKFFILSHSLIWENKPRQQNAPWSTVLWIVSVQLSIPHISVNFLAAVIMIN
jgi:hypothetical protein